MKKIISSVLLSCLMFLACQPQQNSQSEENNEMKDWKEQLSAKLPLLGHRNWVVVTDMAYPLQTNPGITTLMADDDFEQVISAVAGMLDSAPHVFPHIYLDSEQHALSEELAPGWDEYRKQVDAALPAQKVQYVDHEQLIRRLDEAAQLFQVVIIKTHLTLPYTSVFFELDCRYWDAEREAKIRQ